MTAGFSVTGAEGYTETMQRLAQKYPEAAGEGAYKFCEEVMSESHDECPYQTHTLQRSGLVNEPVVTPEEISCTMGYNEVYAAAQHENLNYHHEHGKAKFLEDPLMRNFNQLPVDIQEKLDDAIAEETK
jgi:ribosome modulation factor